VAGLRAVSYCGGGLLRGSILSFLFGLFVGLRRVEINAAVGGVRSFAIYEGI
jgi:LytS/YehU family sensor histidine kinase